jgi:hypothetical protein
MSGLCYHILCLVAPSSSTRPANNFLFLNLLSSFLLSSVVRSYVLDPFPVLPTFSRGFSRASRSIHALACTISPRACFLSLVSFVQACKLASHARYKQNVSSVMRILTSVFRHVMRCSPGLACLLPLRSSFEQYYERAVTSSAASTPNHMVYRKGVKISHWALGSVHRG